MRHFLFIKLLKALRGFSLIEIMVSLVVISVMTAALTPILTKRMKANMAAVKMEGAVKYKCANKFGENCRLCYKHGCLYCEMACSVGNTKVTKDCKCHSCKEAALHGAACKECNEFKCTKCEAGYYVTGGKCAECPAGNWCDGTATIHPCAIGYYQPNKKQSSCSPCPAAKYTSSTGQSACAVCDKGYYCPGGTNRQACNTGKYQDATGQSACKTCVAGKYSPTSGAAASCTNCAAGKWSGAGASSCPLNCDAGYYCPGNGTKPACAAGKWSNAGASSCTLNCTAGYYCPGNGTKPACAAGKWSNAGASSCTLNCDAGYYCPGNGTKVPCAAGKWSNAGSSSCTLSCPAGYYCPGDGRKIPCPAGKFSTGGAGASCTSCSAGYACSSTGQSICSAGTYASAGATSCTTCSAGTYNTAAGSTGCSACGSGYYCSGGSNRVACSALGCSGCSASSGTCTSCAAGSYISGGKCLACPDRYYCPDGVTPRLCEPIDENHACDKVIGSYQCYENGSITFGGGNRTCKSCGDNCERCANENSCFRCKEGFYPIQECTRGNCFDKCGKCKDSEVWIDFKCKSCESYVKNCKTCHLVKSGSSDKVKCDSCGYGTIYYDKENNPSDDMNGQGSGCYSCPEGCTKCSFTTTNKYTSSTNFLACSECKTGYTLKEVSRFGGCNNRAVVRASSKLCISNSKLTTLNTSLSKYNSWPSYSLNSVDVQCRNSFIPENIKLLQKNTNGSLKCRVTNSAMSVGDSACGRFAGTTSVDNKFSCSTNNSAGFGIFYNPETKYFGVSDNTRWDSTSGALFYSDINEFNCVSATNSLCYVSKYDLTRFNKTECH